MRSAGPSITFGLPEEQADFARRNARFFEVWPRLQEAINHVFDRPFAPTDEAQAVVFTLGRLVVEDFMEVLLACGNGYGMAGLKLLRPMFEATITARYIGLNPAEARVFLEYACVHQRKAVKLAELVGVDLSRRVPPSQQDEVEKAYQAIKHHYRQVVCDKCGTERELASWTKKDVVAMAREVGLGPSVIGPYFLPTLQIHTTAVRLTSRLEETADAIAFNPGPQRREADAVACGAHVCLAVVLEGQNRYFQLGLDDEALQRDLEHAWPGPIEEAGAS